MHEQVMYQTRAKAFDQLHSLVRSYQSEDRKKAQFKHRLEISGRLASYDTLYNKIHRPSPPMEVCIGMVGCFILSIALGAIFGSVAISILPGLMSLGLYGMLAWCIYEYRLKKLCQFSDQTYQPINISNITVQPSIFPADAVQDAISDQQLKSAVSRLLNISHQLAQDPIYKFNGDHLGILEATVDQARNWALYSHQEQQLILKRMEKTSDEMQKDLPQTLLLQSV